jgi:beta-xylosidase
MAPGYQNPVLPGFHPDPSVCRVGDTYYLATSTFTYFPGVPIFRSTNLVDWVQIGNALARPEQLDLSGTAVYASLGIFAPTLRHHDGRFWLTTTNFTARGGRALPDNFIVTATDPAGPWSDPIRIPLRGIDPDLAWGPDGSCWVHYSNGRRIERCRVDADRGEVLEGPEPVWSGTGGQFPEAPHLFERDGAWYLVIAEGGTERGHGVSIARAAGPTGPWEPCPHNPILSHRSTDRPIQNTGHADFVEAPDGTWWMVLLGTRPRGGSPLFHVLGRETFLAPVDWVDGWPVVASVDLTVERRPPGERAAPAARTMRDDFDEKVLDLGWLAVRRPPGEFTCLETRPGWLTIDGDDARLDDAEPTFLGWRQQHERCRASALVNLGSAHDAGLAIRMDDHFHYAVGVTAERVVARACIGGLEHVIGEMPLPTSGTVEVYLETAAPTTYNGPDDVIFGYVAPEGGRQVLARLDGRFLSTEVAGGMIGRVLGPYALGGKASFDWFEYEPLDG